MTIENIICELNRIGDMTPDEVMATAKVAANKLDELNNLCLDMVVALPDNGVKDDIVNYYRDGYNSINK